MEWAFIAALAVVGATLVGIAWAVVWGAVKLNASTHKEDNPSG